jgi:hypothetical protein
MLFSMLMLQHRNTHALPPSLLQGLDDHTHMPTLQRLDRNLPVIANAAAAERIAPLGYKSVTVLDHSQSTTVCDGKLRITATAGVCQPAQAGCCVP